MSANLENSAVATGLEKVSFHSNPKEGQCQRMFKLPYNHANFHMLAKLCSKSFKLSLRFPDGTCGKESTCQCRRHSRRGSIPGSRRPPGGGQGNPLPFSCLENPTDRGAWWATAHAAARVRHDSGTNPAPAAPQATQRNPTQTPGFLPE